MRYHAIAQVEGYWHGLANREKVPNRSSVDPRGIQNVLEYTFLLERVASGVGRIRLAGSHLTDILGMEVRGMPFTAFFAPEAREQIAQAIDMVCDGPQLADVTIRSSGLGGRNDLSGRLFLAPLRDQHGHVSKILGCLQTRGTIGRAPRRFDTAHVLMRSLITARPTPAVEPRQIAFAEEPAPFQHAPKAQSGPHLRLVHSAD